MNRQTKAIVTAFAQMIVCLPMAIAQSPSRIAGTEQLTLEGDIASHLVAGVDRFLLGELEKSVERRKRHWRYDFSSATAYAASVEPNRKRLAHIIGVRDKRIGFDAPELIGTTEQPALVGRGNGYNVYAIRWPAFEDVYGEGLLLVPTTGEPVADIVAIGDADQAPEMLAGLIEGVDAESQFARRLAESGCRVLVPTLISRKVTQRMSAKAKRGIKLANREFLYRAAFEMGRHIIGYEVQKVLAAVDWFVKKNDKIGVIGWGEGGLIALYAGALDTRIDAVCVSGYFDSRQNVWRELIERNVFGLLDEFGDAELAAMVVPRKLIIEAGIGPEVTIAPGTRAAPGRLVTPKLRGVRAEFQRLKKLVAPAYDSSARMMPAHCSALMAPVPLSVSRSIRTSSAGMRKTFMPARSSASSRCWWVVMRMGSTTLIRKGSIMVFMAVRIPRFAWPFVPQERQSVKCSG